MITTALIWITLIFLFYLYGNLLLRCMQWSLRLQRQTIQTISSAIVCLVGLSGLMVLSSYLSLWRGFSGIGIRLLIVIIPSLYGIIDYSWMRQQLQRVLKVMHNSWHSPAAVLGVLFSCIIIYQSVSLPPHPDTGLYHEQAIMWIQQYGVVPGLANLYPNLGFNSNWFLPVALFNIPRSPYELVHSLNGLWWLLIVIILLQQVAQLRHNTVKRSACAALILLVLTSLTYWFNGYYHFFHPYMLSSPSTELPVFALTFLNIVLLLDLFEHKPNWQQPTVVLQASIISLLSIIALTIKLNALPLAIFSVYLIIQWLLTKQWRYAIHVGIVGLITSGGWLIRNVILTGYIIYPVPIRLFDWFKFYWKMPFQDVQTLSIIIKAWAIDTGKPTGVVLGSGISYWFPIWFHSILFHPLIMNLLIPSLFIFLSCIIWNMAFLRQYLQMTWLVWFIVLCNIIFLFISAPDIIRFGLGILLSFAMLAFLPMIQIIFQRFPKFSSYPQLVAIVLLFMILNSIQFADRIQWSQIWWRVVPYTQPAWTPQRLKQYDVNIQSYCWNSSLPCTSYLQPNLELRSNNLKDGFRLKE